MCVKGKMNCLLCTTLHLPRSSSSLPFFHIPVKSRLLVVLLNLGWCWLSTWQALESLKGEVSAYVCEKCPRVNSIHCCAIFAVFPVATLKHTSRISLRVRGFIMAPVWGYNPGTTSLRLGPTASEVRKDQQWWCSAGSLLFYQARTQSWSCFPNLG